jgi:hypothetical protein
MNDVDALARAEVAALLPIPSGVQPDWEDVLRRARLPHRGLWRAAVLAAAVGAFAVAAAASPLGAALARAFDDFSAWIRGEPGQPASPAEQQAFQEANARSWAGFAPDARLRRLLETEVSGTSFTLFGFRSGDLLCLRLVATGGVSGTSTHCAPLRSLQRAASPALVVAADEPVGSSSKPAGGEGYTADAYTATFGIASDGVRGVVVKADDGTHDALVGGNAFLYLADHPKVGTRVRGVEAVASNGERARLAFQSSPFGMLDLPPPPKGEAQGPTRVERHVSGGSIGWVERQELRGEPLPESLRPRIEDMSSHMLANVRPVLERVVRPDPGDVLRMGILAGASREGGPLDTICYLVIGPGGIGGTCDRIDRLFARGPFTLSLGGSGPSQYSLLSGLASDDVAALRVFVASGKTIDVPLSDNAYFARVARGDFPIRLVAYDREDRVIGTQAFRDDGMTSRAPPRARTTVRRLARVVGDDGGTATLRAGEPVGGYRCWTIDFGDGHGGGGCTPWPSKERPLLFLHLDNDRADLFLTGQVPPPVASVRVTFADGTSTSVSPISGFVVYAIPSQHVADGRVFVGLTAYDASGRELDRRGLSGQGASGRVPHRPPLKKARAR